MAEKKTTTKKTTAKKKADTTKKEKILKPDVISTGGSLVINPLMKSNTMITPEVEVENKIALMEEIDSVASLNKRVLAVKREKIQLDIQNKSLDEALKIIDGMSTLTDVILDDKVLKKVKNSIQSTRDVKELAVAYGIFADKLQQLQGDNVLEEMGFKKRMKISVAFQNEVGDKAGVQVEV